MTRYASPRLRGYAVITGLALLAALIGGRPEPVALAAPFLVFLAVALVTARSPTELVTVTVGATRALEGDAIPLTIVIDAGAGPASELQLELLLPRWVEPRGPAEVQVRLPAGERRRLDFELTARRWGVHRVGAVLVRSRDRLGLFTWEQALGPVASVRVYPSPERLRALIAPRRTQALSGDRLARTIGDGLEFADVRPFVPGDRIRRINWRVTARRTGPLYVNAQHPDRNADVILFLDTFEEARSPDGSTLDMALRAGASLATAHLQRRDRVGVVGFGGLLRWLEPALGLRARYRIADALLQSQITFSYVWKTVEVIPPRLLPAGALVIGISPLLDPRGVQALLDLHRRGYDLSILECSPESFLAAPESPSEELGRRLWRLRREVLRAQIRALGVAISEWQPDRPAAIGLEEVIASRQRGRNPLRV